ncbi:unnamed protein product [Lepidochelys olivacea]
MEVVHSIQLKVFYLERRLVHIHEKHESSLEHQDEGILLRDEGSSQHQTDTEVEKIYSPSERHVEIEVNEVEERKDEEVTNKLQFGEPVSLPTCDDRVWQILVEHGPEQVHEFPFPKDGNKKKKFSAQHYKRKLIHGEEIHRKWLQYLVSKDSVFFFCCKLFRNQAIGIPLTENGSKDWENISSILSSHERSTEHLECFQNWKELELRLKKGKTVDEENLCVIKEKEEYWQQILERLIALVRFLSGQNLAFCGHGRNEKL